MLIKCISNSSDLIPDWSRYNSMPLSEVLHLGEYYLVYGLLFTDSGLSYEILTIHNYYTRDYPSLCFEVVDNRLSKFFSLGKVKAHNNKIFPFISFKEWAEDTTYFEKLTEGNKEATRIFNDYKELLFLEYRHPGINQVALAIQDKWVQCPVCTEAWELNFANFEMCECPKCSTVLLTPVVSSVQEKRKGE